MMPYTIAVDPYFMEAAKTRTPDELEAAVLLLEFHSHGRPVAAPKRGQGARRTRRVQDTDTKRGSERESRLTRSAYRLRAGSKTTTNEHEGRRQTVTTLQGSPSPRNGQVNAGVVAIPENAVQKPSAQARLSLPSETRTEVKETPRRSARLAKAKPAAQEQR